MRLSRAKLEFDLSVFEPFEFGAVVVLELFLEFAEGAFDHGDEGFSKRGATSVQPAVFQANLLFMLSRRGSDM